MSEIAVVGESMVVYVHLIGGGLVDGVEDVGVLRREVLEGENVNGRELILSMGLATLRVSEVPRFTMV